MSSFPSPRAILFDLDDTLIDDTGPADELWREVVVQIAREGRGFEPGAALAAIFRVRSWYWSDSERHREGRADLRAATRWIVAQALPELATPRNDLAARIAETYRDRRDAALRLFPETLPLLARVRSRGIRTALLTNGSARHQRMKIDRFGLDPYFDVVLIEGETGFGKPDPRVYTTALEALGASAAEAWMVGDNLEWDVSAPQGRGLHAVWVDREGRGLPPETGVRPDRIVRHVGEVME